MISLLKGIILGALGGWLIPLLANRMTGATGGVLGLHIAQIGDFSFHWSWPIFLLASGFAFILFKMLE